MSKSYIVHKDIPIPAPKWSAGRTKGTSKYKWMLDLSLGDHIVVENQKEADCLTNAMLRLTEGTRSMIQRKMQDNKIGLWVKQVSKRRVA